MRFSIALLALACSSCATSGDGKNGGVVPDDAFHEARATAVTEERARYDLDCQELTLTRLGDVTRLGGQMTSMSIGVRGCDKKASYVVECVSNWGNVTCNPQLNSKE